MFLLAAIIAVVLVNTRGKRRLETLAESPILGYLPDDTNVIIAADMEEASRTEEGQETLRRIGLGTGQRFDLERLVGLKSEEIEQVLLGLRVDKAIPPRIRLVVRTKSDINLDAVYSKLGRKLTKKVEGREYGIVQPPMLPGLELALWSPSPRTIVAVYPSDELEKVPAEPNSQVERFAAPMVELLKARSQRDTFFWVIAHSESWKDTSLPMMLLLAQAPLTNEGLKMLNEIRTLGVAMRKDSGVTVTRSRPARIIEESTNDPRNIAMDLVLFTAPGTEMPPMVDALEGWAERQKLAIRESNREGNRFTTIFAGTAEDWERAFASLRGQTK